MRLNLIVVALLTAGHAGIVAADSDRTYDGSDICGYGKIEYVAITDSGLQDRFLLRLDSMPSSGEYLKFQNQDVVSVRESLGVDVIYDETQAAAIDGLFGALWNDKAVRILGKATSGTRCDQTFDYFDIKLCSSWRSCWDDTYSLSVDSVDPVKE
ncbi:hypothetical protein [Tahibacter soli]|uniref:Uncharacterized protein n=1 Tax=Tahibacter soli TaxID=2983605 RepID=A0A9X3YSB5_9GAMM|nr:hypothetical protein [Tahibacter soli]MDC8015466.1 hypothetical protein [Tahibacter soli]